MFGYACNETENAIPLTLEISNEILKELSILKKRKNIRLFKARF